MAILVTGGTGFIGSHTCVELLNNNFEIVVVDNFYNSKEEVIASIKEITKKDFKFYAYDVSDYASMSKVFKENKIEVAIHFAGYKAVGESIKKPLMYYENNLLSTINLCKVMSENNCFKLVFSSTATVYGNTKTCPVKEDFPLSTTNPYATTKLFIEQILTDLHIADERLSIIMLRYFNPIGAHKSGLIGENPNGIPNNLMPYINKVAAKELTHLNIFGNDYDTHDGTGVRDYIHVSDLARGHVCALYKILNTSGVSAYNLGTGIGYSVLDIVNIFEKTTNIKIDYKIIERRPGDIATSFSDSSKAKEELGFTCLFSIDEMCRDGWNYIVEENKRTKKHPV